MTNKALLNSLNEAEYLLVAETQRAAMAELDEDQLVELHKRIRRARSKYVKKYRRGASARVAEVGGRGKASARNRRAADLAEVFEEALARVSTALAAAARRSAAELKAERLAMAQGATSSTGPEAGPSDPASPIERATPKRTKTPIARKEVAATRATGARRQAKRDAR